jgi:dienelactone hydrolase
MALYKETETASRGYRVRYLNQMLAWLQAQEAQATTARRAFFQPDCSSLPRYVASTAPYRQQFREMLGWPLTSPAPDVVPALEMNFVAEDELGTIYRVWIEALPGLATYGLYFLPAGSGPFALVISQHGGEGTPEFCSGFHYDSANYNDMSRRFLRRGMAVFAPQLLMWNANNGPAFDRNALDARLRGIGGTLRGLECWQLQRALDALTARPEIDPQRVAMAGLSFGGFYTHFMGALDPRIKVSYCSCMLYDQPGKGSPDGTWTNVASRFGFYEVSGLICPRPFYLELGEFDSLVPPVRAPELTAQVQALYGRLGIAERFVYKLHGGWHEFGVDDEGLDFVQRHLAAAGA